MRRGNEREEAVLGCGEDVRVVEYQEGENLICGYAVSIKSHEQCVEDLHRGERGDSKAEWCSGNKGRVVQLRKET